MRQGSVDISLVNALTGLKYRERTVNGQVCVVEAVPEQEYHVRVTVYDDNPHFPHKGYLKLELVIDGQGVGYCGLVGPLREEFEPTYFDFEGFARSSSSVQDYMKMSRFKFEKAEPLALKQEDMNHRMGRIQVRVMHGYELTKMLAKDFGNPQCSNRVLADKKWWKQPSLYTEVGNETGSMEVTCNSLLDRQCRVVQQLNLRYHTAEVLNLLEMEAKAAAERKRTYVNLIDGEGEAMKIGSVNKGEIEVIDLRDK